MKHKIKVAILFGGKSAEHEVSLQSAKSVYEALDKNKYEPVLVGIDKKGKWHLSSSSKFLLNDSNPKLIKLNNQSKEISVVPGEEAKQLVPMGGEGESRGIDVVFPVLHGTFGEDGTVQGLLKLMDVPFVGPSVLGSAVGMDKEVAKRLLRDAGIPIAKFVCFKAHEKNQISFSKIKKELGLPLFVKPANLGSSVGISKVKNEKEFKKAIDDAFLYDSKILIEEYIKGREIEVAVLGNEHPRASTPGEIIPTHEFYSYEAKYIDENGALLQIPAKLPKPVVKKVQELAVRTFKVLECEGMARVDFFVTKSGKACVNEINTIPGFTKISMYPKLWEASGVKYPELINRLIQLAIDRFNREKKLKTSYEA
jgi:D-alanine-D-alanine ligase